MGWQASRVNRVTAYGRQLDAAETPREELDAEWRHFLSILGKGDAADFAVELNELIRAMRAVRTQIQRRREG